jgi:hypothetical protein
LGVGICSLSKLDIALNADASYFRIRTSILIPGEWPVSADFVEKVEKSSMAKTRQMAFRWNIAA